jgi:sarcosine oxidase
MCDAEVIVIGAGIMGVAAGNALARAGRSVIVLEQFGPGHDRGSSHGTARVFKVSYPDPVFVRLAKAALAQWRELEDETGNELLATTGSIDVGGIVGRREALDQSGATYEFLDAAEVNRRFRLRIDDDADALFQPDGGVLHADRAHEAFVRAGRARGAAFLYGTRARRLAVDDESVLVGTSAGDVRAHAVVVTAGAWMSRIVRPLGLQPIVAPARETVAYFQPRAQPHAPPLSDWRPQENRVIYGIVARDGLLKVGVSGSGVPTDPDGRAEVDRAIVRDAAVWAARRYELVDDAPVASETCLYTNTPDERFIIERHGRLVIGSACSGHGFKFAPVIGERLASLALEAIAA